MEQRAGAQVHRAWCLGIIIAGMASATAVADAQYSAPVGKNYPANLYWGDTHLHSRNSADALLPGQHEPDPGGRLPVRAGRGNSPPTTACACACAGHWIFWSSPTTANTSAATTDLAWATRWSQKPKTGRQWAQMVAEGNPDEMISAFTGSMADPESHPPFPYQTRKLIWQDVAQTADDYNDPGRFTTITGYEWTIAIDGNNLHRVVLFRDGADTVGQLPPFSGQESKRPARPVAGRSRATRPRTGGEVIAIPHNGNLSNGMMFPLEIGGRPAHRSCLCGTALALGTHRRGQPGKGRQRGPPHPFRPMDEFADFENWGPGQHRPQPPPRKDWMLPHEYARGSAQARPWATRQKLGVNPFKFGMIGSTDNHTSLATASEDNYFGKFVESEPGTARLEKRDGQQPPSGRTGESSPPGYARGLGAGRTHATKLFAAMKTPRGLRHHRYAHRRALLRRLALRRGRHPRTHLPRYRLRPRRADGRRPNRPRPRAARRRSLPSPPKIPTGQTWTASRL